MAHETHTTIREEEVQKFIEIEQSVAELLPKTLLKLLKRQASAIALLLQRGRAILCPSVVSFYSAISRAES